MEEILMLPTVPRVSKLWICQVNGEDEIYLGNEKVKNTLERPDIQIHHLYTISHDDKIKSGDWFINTGNRNTVSQAKKDLNPLAESYCKKILSTTDPLIDNLNMSDDVVYDFIESYMKNLSNSKTKS
jgi:hypothetical protein